MIIDNKEFPDCKECPDCNGSGFAKGCNEFEWETFLEQCESCNGDGCAADQ